MPEFTVIAFPSWIFSYSDTFCKPLFYCHRPRLYHIKPLSWEFCTPDRFPSHGMVTSIRFFLYAFLLPLLISPSLFTLVETLVNILVKNPLYPGRPPFICGTGYIKTLTQVVFPWQFHKRLCIEFEHACFS